MKTTPKSFAGQDLTHPKSIIIVLIYEYMYMCIEMNISANKEQLFFSKFNIQLQFSNRLFPTQK